MAIFEKEKKESKHYLVILDASKENVVAIVNPVAKITLELLATSLESKGLNVEIRESKPEILELAL